MRYSQEIREANVLPDTHGFDGCQLMWFGIGNKVVEWGWHIAENETERHEKKCPEVSIYTVFGLHKIRRNKVLYSIDFVK